MANDLGARIVLRLKDEASQGIQNIKEAFGGMTGAAETAGDETSDHLDHAFDPLDDAGEHADAAADSLGAVPDAAEAAGTDTAAALEGATDPLADVEHDTDAAAASFGTIPDAAEAAGDQTVASLDGIAQPLEQSAAKIQQFTDKLGTLPDNAAGAATATKGALAGIKGKATALAGALGIGGVTSAATSMEDALASIESRAPGASGQLDAIADAAQRAAERSGDFSSPEIVGAMEQMTRAGWDVEESMDAIYNATDLAEAAQTDLHTATNTLTGVMAAYNADADEAQEYTDLLAAASANSVAELGELQRILGRAAPQANELGIELDELVAAMVTMSNEGGDARIAGRRLERILSDLERVSREGADGMEGLADGNLSLADALDVAHNGTEAQTEALDSLDTAGRRHLDTLHEHGVSMQEIQEIAEGWETIHEGNKQRILQHADAWDDLPPAAQAAARSLTTGPVQPALDDLAAAMEELEAKSEGSQGAIGEFSTQARAGLQQLGADGGEYLEETAAGLRDFGHSAEEMGDITDDTFTGVIGHIRETSRNIAQDLGEGALDPFRRGVEAVNRELQDWRRAGHFQAIGQQVGAFVEESGQALAEWMDSFDMTEFARQVAAGMGQALNTMQRGMRWITEAWGPLWEWVGEVVEKTWAWIDEVIGGGYQRADYWMQHALHQVDRFARQVWGILTSLLDFIPIVLSTGQAFFGFLQAIRGAIQGTVGFVTHAVTRVTVHVLNQIRTVAGWIEELLGLIGLIPGMAGLTGLDLTGGISKQMHQVEIMAHRTGEAMREGGEALAEGVDHFAQGLTPDHIREGLGIDQLPDEPFWPEAEAPPEEPREEPRDEQRERRDESRRVVELELMPGGDAMQLDEDMAEVLLDQLEGAGARAMEYD